MPEMTPEQEADQGWEIALRETNPPEEGEEENPETEPPPEQKEPEAGSEEEEEEGESLPPPEPDPLAVKEQARRSLYGRIEAERKRIEKGEHAYRQQFGPLPWDKTPEDLQREAEAQEAIKKLATELPEVDKAIESKIDARMRQMREELGGQMEQVSTSSSLAADVAYITAIHPDYGEICTPGTPMNDLLNTWVSALPTELGMKIFEIDDHGTPQEKAAVISAFKEDFAALQAEGSSEGTTEQSTPFYRPPPAGVDEVVRAGPSKGPKGKPDPNNADQGWEDALRELTPNR